ncbi:MAG: sugar ABC transporter permease [Alphaproteobacteria bacterium]|nr:sugar ABC transporter permease [Alphaproteobacteria bacterium]
MASVSVIDVVRPSTGRRSFVRNLRGGLQGSEYAWAIAFCIPYVGVFVAFVIFPVLYGLWLGHAPSLYVELFHDPIYQQTVVNTIIYLAIGVNLKMFLALLLSGFFMRKGWWVKGLLMIYVLPWAVPALPTFISIHWMLNTEWGLINNVLWDIFHVDGPGWLDTSRWLALGSVIVSYIWKNMPFWTVILLAGRMAIPQELYEAGEVDGATGLKRFFHISFPLLANLYLVCTLLSTIFTLGDFNTANFISGGGPALSTHVLATLGIRDAFEIARPQLGVAAVLSALPLMIPLVMTLMHKLRTSEVQL